MWIEFNNNPIRKTTGDCVIRALSKALGKPWEKIYLDLFFEGLKMYDLPNSNAVWDSYLRQNGYERHGIPNTCPDCYTIEDFTNDNPYGRYIVATGTHVVPVIDGDIYDFWDSSGEVATYYYAESE